MVELSDAAPVTAEELAAEQTVAPEDASAAATRRRGRVGWRRLAGGVLLGLVAGVGWGVAARAWMRLISTSPEFSWAGTLFILGSTGLVGVLLGLAVAARSGQRGRLARGLAAAALFPLGLGQGVVMLPAIVLGAFALPGRRPGLLPRLLLAALGSLGLLVITGASATTWAGVALLVLALASGVAFRLVAAGAAAGSVVLVVTPFFDGALPPLRAAAGAITYLGLLAPVALIYARVARRPDGGVAPIPPTPPSTTVGGRLEERPT